MTDKYDNFISELDDLCRAHQVKLSTSMYDSIQVWDMSDDMETIYYRDIEDMTNDQD